MSALVARIRRAYQIVLPVLPPCLSFFPHVCFHSPAGRPCSKKDITLWLMIQIYSSSLCKAAWTLSCRLNILGGVEVWHGRINHWAIGKRHWLGPQQRCLKNLCSSRTMWRDWRVLLKYRKTRTAGGHSRNPEYGALSLCLLSLSQCMISL